MVYRYLFMYYNPPIQKNNTVYCSCYTAICGNSDTMLCHRNLISNILVDNKVTGNFQLSNYDNIVIVAIKLTDLYNECSNKTSIKNKKVTIVNQHFMMIRNIYNIDN